jgi:hypothetical protein
MFIDTYVSNDAYKQGALFLKFFFAFPRFFFPLKSLLTFYQILIILEFYNKFFRLLMLMAWTWKLTYLILVLSIQCLRPYSGNILPGRLGAVRVIEIS